MKKNIPIFLLTFTLILSLLLSGCGQTSTTTPSPENDTSVTIPAEDANTQVDEPEIPEDTQPTDTDASINELDSNEGEPDSEPADPAEDAPETEDPVAESSEPTPKPVFEQIQEQEQPETEQTPEAEPESVSTPEQTPEPEQQPEPDPEPEPTPASSPALSGTDLILRFGGGEEFTIHLYDNDTANKIAEYVGTASWQLPIYHFDDYDGWESFQYYDIPSRYDIPDGSPSVASEKAGAVYYSHPNRIILFYQDANISTEYTPVGYVDFSQELVDAVENNPVVEGWGNKLIFIQP